VGPLAVLAGRAGLLVADRTGPPVGSLPEAPAVGWLVVVGPEGGLSSEEVAALAGRPVGLGSHVLRAGTAALALAAALQSRRSSVAACEDDHC
jgi:16S rRNA (uracil1498-N3)-methyltransferase